MSVSGSLFGSVSESGLVFESCNRSGERKWFRKSVKSYKINYWANILYNVFISILNCVRMMEEAPESEFRELVDNPTRERPQVADQPMLLVEDDESLLDMEEEEADEIMLLERAIAAAPSGASSTADASPAAAPTAAASPAAAPSAATTAAAAPLDGVYTDTEQIDQPLPAVLWNRNYLLRFRFRFRF
jgi:biotin carboxyl carrier protein